MCLAVPAETLIKNRDFMGAALPFTNESHARLERRLRSHVGNAPCVLEFRRKTLYALTRWWDLSHQKPFPELRAPAPEAVVAG